MLNTRVRDQKLACPACHSGLATAAGTAVGTAGTVVGTAARTVAAAAAAVGTVASTAAGTAGRTAAGTAAAAVVVAGRHRSSRQASRMRRECIDSMSQESLCPCYRNIC